MSTAPTLAPTLTSTPTPAHEQTRPEPPPAASQRTEASDGVGHLRPISLGELNQAAQLLTRVDRKYLLPQATAAELLTSLADAAVLEINARRSLAYVSVYFDTPELDSYLATARPRRRRFKVRTRAYLDTATAYLEVKTRGPRGTNVKRRVPTDPARMRHLTQAQRSHLAAQLHTQAEPGLIGRLQPTLRTRYNRTTVLLPDDAARLTLDRELSWTRLDADGQPVSRASASGLVIVESKSSSTPSAADRWLWSHGIRPVRVSKYGTGMAILDPTLPANRWHRVIRQVQRASR